MLLFVGCGTTSYLVSPERDQKVLIVEAGDISGESSLKLTKAFQDVRPANLVLNPGKYVSTIKYVGGDISKETLTDLNKEDIAFVIMISNLRLDLTYNVGPCQASNYLDIAYDENGNFVEKKSKDYNSKICTYWHNLQVNPTANFVIYDTKSATKIYQGNYPPPPSPDVFSKVNKYTSMFGLTVSGSVSKPKVLEGTCPKTSTCWHDRFFSSQKSPENPKIVEKKQVIEAEAVKKILAYIAKLSK